MDLIRVLVVAFGIHADPAVVATIETVAAEHSADVATLAAIAVKESRVGTVSVPHLLMGAHVYRPCAPGEAPRRGARGTRRCFDRSPWVQGRVAAVGVGRARRPASIRAWLASWVCGPSVACRNGNGVAYAAQVMSYRARIAALLRAP